MTSETLHYVEPFDHDPTVDVAEANEPPPAVKAPYPWARTLTRIVVDAVLVLLGAATLSFFVLHSLPGNPVDILITDPEATAEQRAQVTADYGLDKPVAVQYVFFVGKLAQGDLGESFLLRRPVVDAIGAEVWSTIRLALAALGLVIVAATTIAVATSGRARVARSAASTLELVAISIPSFWIGLVLLSLLSYRFAIFPDSGDEGFQSLVLPAVAVAAGMIGILTQVLRQGMESTLRQPFITAARTRALTETSVRVVHALRHSMLAGLTLSAMFFGFVLGGAVISETIFSRPGIGRLALLAINNRDIPLVTGIVLFCALAFVVVNTIVDLLYPLVDPRLRTDRTRTTSIRNDT